MYVHLPSRENKKCNATRHDPCPLHRGWDINHQSYQFLVTAVDVHAVCLEEDSAWHMANALGYVDTTLPLSQ